MAIVLPDPLSPVTLPGVPQDYPHVEGIADWQAQQSLRLAWTQIHALQAQVLTLSVNQASIMAAFNTLLTAVEQISIEAEQAYAQTQEP